MTQVDELIYRGEAQVVQVAAVPEQVAQLGSHVLQILLSETSPYSLFPEQLAPHDRVPLFPHNGVGQAVTQLELVKNLDESQLVQVVAVVKQVKQLGLQFLQILLSDTSPY